MSDTVWHLVITSAGTWDAYDCTSRTSAIRQANFALANGASTVTISVQKNEVSK